MEVEVAGRRRVVDVRPVAGGSIVTIDGQAIFVNAVRAGERWSLLVGDNGANVMTSAVGAATAGDPARGWLRSYDVWIGRHAPGELAVMVNGIGVRVSVAGRMARPSGSREEAVAGPSPIVAPMPGRIVKVLVQVGEVVAANQPVVVVEAMKMENELRTPRGGTVVEVRAVEGSLVEAKTILLVVDSAEVLPQGS